MVKKKERRENIVRRRRNKRKYKAKPKRAVWNKQPFYVQYAGELAVIFVLLVAVFFFMYFSNKYKPDEARSYEISEDVVAQLGQGFKNGYQVFIIEDDRFIETDTDTLPEEFSISAANSKVVKGPNAGMRIRIAKISFPSKKLHVDTTTITFREVGAEHVVSVDLGRIRLLAQLIRSQRGELLFVLSYED